MRYDPIASFLLGALFVAGIVALAWVVAAG